MNDFRGSDNIYWLFSSSAQAIAAFIGFLAAGFFFAYEKMDKQIEKDETLVTAIGDIKLQYFRRLKALLIITGFSIVLSLAVVWLNGYDLGLPNLIFQILVGVLNVVTVVVAISFVIFIIDPSKITETTEKLIEENKEVFTPAIGKSIDSGYFLNQYNELEDALRSLINAVGFNFSNRRNNVLSTNEIIRILYERRLIDNQSMKSFFEVNKIRNLVAHGHVATIDQNIDSMLQKLITTIKNIKDVTPTGRS